MMKHIFTLLLAFSLSTGLSQNNIGIGTTTPNASAIVDISSTNRGLLLPRTTAVQRNNMTSAANGLVVYDTDSAAIMLRSAGWAMPLRAAANGSATEMTFITATLAGLLH